MNNLADPKTLQEIVKDRMDGKIAEFLPDELFDAMLKQGIENLTRATHAHRSPFEPNGSPVSFLQKLIDDELLAYAKSKVKDALDKASEDGRLKAFDPKPDDIINRAIELNRAGLIEQFFITMMSQSVQGSVQHMRNELANSGIITRPY